MNLNKVLKSFQIGQDMRLVQHSKINPLVRQAEEFIGEEEKAENEAKHAQNMKKVLKQNPYFRKIEKFK